MAKRKETLELEEALNKNTREKRIYGCEEITIGFYNNGHGNEIVDFMTMDSKGIIKCYELKVTVQDLKSNAKKSWYGHYNYLVISKELYDSVEDWSTYIPKHVGLIVGTGLSVIKKPVKQDIDTATELMLKESMIRSIYWKIDKYKNASDLEKRKQLMSKLSKAEKERDKYYKETIGYDRLINKYEKYKMYNDGLDDFNLQVAAEEEYKKYKESLKNENQMCD